MDDTQIKTPASETLTPTIEAEQDSAEEMDEALAVKIARFLRLCWARRKTILWVSAAGALISLLLAVLLPATYISTTTLMPPDNTSPYSSILSALSSPVAARTSQTLGLKNEGELFVKILESKNVQDGLIARFDLRRHYKVRLNEDARKSLANDALVTEDVRSGVIAISVKAKTPTLAADLANAYVTELNRVVTATSTSSARRERIFLEGRLREVKKDLDGSSQALSEFSTKNKAIDLPAQAKSLVDAELKLEAELIDSRSELAALKQMYSSDNTRVKVAEARTTELKRQINEVGGISAGNSDSDDSPYPPVLKLPTLGVEYYNLEREVTVDEAEWEALTKEYEAAKVEEAKETPTVSVLDSADIPVRRSSPRRSLIVAIGTMLSILVACFLVFAVEAWEGMDPEDEPRKIMLEVANAVTHARNPR